VDADGNKPHSIYLFPSLLPERFVSFQARTTNNSSFPWSCGTAVAVFRPGGQHKLKHYIKRSAILSNRSRRQRRRWKEVAYSRSVCLTASFLNLL